MELLDGQIFSCQMEKRVAEIEDILKYCLSGSLSLISGAIPM